MPGLPFTLRQLEVFSSLCATGSFGKTADDLRVSQASVSSQIKALEQQLGISLFFRRPGKRPTLTPEGARFLDDCRAFQLAAFALASHRRETSDADEPIGFRALIGQGIFDLFVRPRLGAFLAANPLIDLHFDTQHPVDGAGSELAEGRFDFAMIHIRADQEVPQHMEPLATVRGGVYGHRSLARGRSLPLDGGSLSELPFILPGAGSSMERGVSQMLAKEGISPTNVVCHTSYYDVIATLLGSATGVASFSDCLLPVEDRDQIVMLYRTVDWRLVWFRKDKGPSSRGDLVQEFLFDSVPRNARYPALEIAPWLLTGAV